MNHSSKVLLASVALLALFARAPRAGDRGPARLQSLSPEGKNELRVHLADGFLATLQEPSFADSQAEATAFYSSEDYALAWVLQSRPTAAARSVIASLEAADDEGLFAKDYDGPLWEARLERLEMPERRASESELLRFDLSLTICAMRYILDVHLGRINPGLYHSSFDVEPSFSGPSRFLRERIAPAQDAAAALSAIEPPFAAYRRLVKAVARYNELAREYTGEPLPLPRVAIKPGDPYGGVPGLARLLRRLGDLSPGAAVDPSVYEGPLVGAVKNFQRRHGIEPNGVLGERTLIELNTPLEQRLRQLRLTLERWRWMPHTFPTTPIIVNIPEFRLYAGEGPSQRVVVGMAFEHQTPVFASLLTEVVFRPAWSVPMSIQLGELVEKIGKNPGFLKENDLEVVSREESLVSSETVTAEVLRRLRRGELNLRQRPGPHNSLGLIKFEMPNPYSVYLHGTPSRWGFERSRRDFSHSCIRVEDPEALAAWVLREQPQWTPERIHAAMQGTETVTARLRRPIPVLIQYGTAMVDTGNEVHFFDDIYGLDAAEGAAFEQRERGGR